MADDPQEFTLGSPAFLLGGEPQTMELTHMAAHLITYDDLAAKGIPYKKPHLWRLEKAGKFPRRVPIGAARYVES